MRRFLLLGAMLGGMLEGQPYTRGVGVYPGDPKEDFSPRMAVDKDAYRNLALRRPAYQSSAYDYNLTAQLINDGIKDTVAPRWFSLSTSAQGALPKHRRERLSDHNLVTTLSFDGARGWVELELNGGERPFELDRMDVDLGIEAKKPAAWSVVVSGSEDGQSWQELGRAAGKAESAAKATVRFSQPSSRRRYRVEMEVRDAASWTCAELALFRQDQRIEYGGPYNFTSAWMSAGRAQEWVYVDLGAVCTFGRVALAWIRRPAEASLQVSDDAVQWRTLRALPADADEVKLQPVARGRYVRVLMERPPAEGFYTLSELEVYGRGGPVARPQPAQSFRDGRLDLAGGAWRLERATRVQAGPEALSQPGFQDQDWVVATVPGTVLSSFLNAGAVPDPNFGNNQVLLSDSFFYSDFWYRNEFTAPASTGKHAWLNFDGINWKADVFLNGQKLGRIEGGFLRARFDVTGQLHWGGKNALAVRIEKNATPGSAKEKTFQDPDLNGGALGADNPTFHASIGWDWIPTVRGRDIGIWNNVFLNLTGPVTIEDPFVRTALSLPDVSKADVNIEATLRNHDSKPVTGTLRGHFGEAAFEQAVTIEPGAAKAVKAALQLSKPKLWWPNGYGDPNLYPVDLKFVAGTETSDSRAFQAGVRQFAYSEEDSALRLWINGKRFIPRGGNWGFSESMLRYRAREYDAAVRYHRDMNFTMIRNWVGMIGEDAFYEACDRYGVVVWQDFWLANPWDGPDPDDNALFMHNARDLVLRIRNHASVGLYCGRNEGYPPKPLEQGIRETLAELHPGLHYISSSADDVVSGHGPYQAMPTRHYFEHRATPKFHSELGMPNIVTLDSLRAMMPEKDMWPLGDVWGVHDFSLKGAQGAASFIGRIQKSYGGADNAADWVSLAQFVNYEGYRAMFEAQSANRMGLLIWMSHPAWPSMVWQTYDYYLEPSAAYFGCKKASEPLHIQWNPVQDSVEVVNYSGRTAYGLTARVEVLNMDGAVKWQKTSTLDSVEDSNAPCIKMEYPAGLTPVHFLRLKLMRGGELVSENFYWRGTEEGNYQALRSLPKVAVQADTRVGQQGGRWVLITELRNPSAQPALMVRVKAVREKSGDRILPALYSDNYVALMPGERRTIRTELGDADTRGEKPRIVVEGFNVAGGA